MHGLTYYRLGDARITVVAGIDDTPERLVGPDVEVLLPDGSAWSATVFTVGDIEAVMTKNAGTGEDLAGSFFACSDLLILRDNTLEELLRVLKALIDSGDVRYVLREISIDAHDTRFSREAD